MKLSAKQYAIALYQAIASTSPKSQDKVLDNFVDILRSAGHLGMMPEIEQEFVDFEKESRGIIQAEVHTSRQLSRDEHSKIIADLNEYAQGQVELKQNIDAGLLGGIMIKIDDTVVDGSIKKSLEQLRQELIK